MTKEVQTRKDEIRFVADTNDLKRLNGMYLTKRVQRTWKEKYLNDRTGEIMDIERSEMILDRGTRLNPDALSRLNFHIQAGDNLTEIEVSNQNRQAEPYNRRGLLPYLLKVNINSHNISVLCQATSCQKAIIIATDYMELNFKSTFEIVGVKSMNNYIIIEHILQRIETEKYPKFDCDDDETEDKEPKDYAVKENAKFYQIDADIKTARKGDIEDTLLNQYSFILKAKNVENAKVIIRDTLEKLFEERNAEAQTESEIYDIVDISLSTATFCTINRIIERDF